MIRHAIALAFLLAFLLGYMLRCKPVELALLGPCPEGGLYELAYIDVEPPELVWSGEFATAECRVFPQVGDRLMAARCGESVWVPAVRAAFDPYESCGGS